MNLTWNERCIVKIPPIKLRLNRIPLDLLCLRDSIALPNCHLEMLDSSNCSAVKKSKERELTVLLTSPKLTGTEMHPQNANLLLFAVSALNLSIRLSVSNN
jgi:hypothetical protein